MKYRKKPIVIEAIQWDGMNIIDVTMFMEKTKPIHLSNRPNADELIGIETLEGMMIASVGDWIIKGIQGEFYTCKPDIFQATYEPVS